MKKAKSTTGVVHYVHSIKHSGKFANGGRYNSTIEPFCDGLINGGFINWKYWPLTTESVTCKNCLRKAGEELFLAKVILTLEGDHKQFTRKRKFATKKELDAYIRGLEDAAGWHRVKVNDYQI